MNLNEKILKIRRDFDFRHLKANLNIMDISKLDYSNSNTEMNELIRPRSKIKERKSETNTNAPDEIAFRKPRGMIHNNSIIQQCIEFIWKIVPWHQLRNIHWKNKKPLAREAYVPTEIEHIANVVTHAVGVVPSLLATYELWSRSNNGAQYISAIVYGATLVFLFSISTSFHCVCYTRKQGPLKDLLHRCDRGMIYIFIAGSYFPWLTIKQFPDDGWSSSMKWFVWLLAILGVTYQQAFHEKYKNLEIFFYLVIGMFPALPIITEHYGFSGMTELKIGGMFYVVGLLFFKSDGSIPCAHAIWHVFVVIAVSVHYCTILSNLYPVLPLQESPNVKIS